jgi:hypothetical protein
MERNRARRRLVSPSMGVAFTALVLALGGTSYAVTKIDPRSVGTPQLKRAAVGGGQIKPNAVTGSKVRNNSLTGRDVNERTLRQVPSAAAAATAATAERATVADRATLAAGLDRIFYVAATATIPAAPDATTPSTATATARCAAGQLVVGGGIRGDEEVGEDFSYPDGAAAWTATASNDDVAAAHTFSVFAICVPAAGLG